MNPDPEEEPPAPASSTGEPSGMGEPPGAGEPSGGGMFSIEGRPAAGLYVLAWLVSGIGLVLFFIAVQVAPPLAGVLLMAALVTLAIGLATTAGYQVVARSDRPANRFQGPSPVLLLGLQLVVSLAIGSVLLAAGLPDPRNSSVGFVAVSATLMASYLFVVWLFGVRSGALSWRDMGVPDLRRRGAWVEAATAIGLGGVTLVLAWPVVTILAGLLALLLNSSPPEVVPPAGTSSDLLLTAIGAALLVPIGEEVLFRGYALTAWLRDLGPRKALIRSTLFFAFAHILGVTALTFDEGWRQALLTVVVITPVGAALGWIFLRRGLLAAIAGHATFNLLSVLTVALAQSLPPPA